MKRPLAVAVLATVVLTLPSPANAGSRSGEALWATINACDSPRFPDMVGVRASMPGDGTGKRMYARFRLQYRRALGRGWAAVAGGRSPKQLLGSARRDRQAGYTFRLNPPPAGGSFLLRGVADLEWQRRSYRTQRVRMRRKGRTVVRRKRVFRRWVVARRLTEVSRGGVIGVRGGEGLSLESCTVR